MSETPKTYAASTEKPEGVGDFYRRALRSIRHIANDGLNPNERIDASTALLHIRDKADTALTSPRSNDAIVDALERQVGDLQSALDARHEADERRKREEPALIRANDNLVHAMNRNREQAREIERLTAALASAVNQARSSRRAPAAIAETDQAELKELRRRCHTLQTRCDELLAELAAEYERASPTLQAPAAIEAALLARLDAAAHRAAVDQDADGIDLMVGAAWLLLRGDQRQTARDVCDVEVEAERDACAQLAERFAAEANGSAARGALLFLAKQIRARGEP